MAYTLLLQVTQPKNTATQDTPDLRLVEQPALGVASLHLLYEAMARVFKKGDNFVARLSMVVCFPQRVVIQEAEQVLVSETLLGLQCFHDLFELF